MTFGLYNALYGQIVNFYVHYQISTVHKKLVVISSLQAVHHIY